MASLIAFSKIDIIHILHNFFLLSADILDSVHMNVHIYIYITIATKIFNIFKNSSVTVVAIGFERDLCEINPHTSLSSAKNVQ